MEFEDLPPEIRVKLYDEQEQQLWVEVNKLGLSEAATQTGYSCSSIYNWRSKDVFFPVDFVSTFLDVEQVKALKGGGRSKPMKNVDFPMEFSDELLTRVDASVRVNREGVPVYQTNERSLLERFAELLEANSVPYSVYNRSVYELRYPKYFHSIVVQEDYSADFAALVDEKGSVEEGCLEAEGCVVDVQKFDGELYSREKALELALQRGDEERIRKIMREEAERVNSLLQ